MKRRWIIFVVSFGLLGSLYACKKQAAHLVTNAALRAYDVEQDSADPQKVVSLHYDQAEGKRIFYDKCVWCHADATPAGPSNRANLMPQPPLLTDGNVLNPLSDAFIRNIVTLGGSALGKSPMMPPWGNTLSEQEIRAVTAYARVVAEPPYQPSARPSSDYGVK
jgi:mono/diheme cytochrome c family protein